MAAMNPVERELVEACGFDGAKYKTRQNYLAALARAIEKIPPEDFDNLTDDAADWYNAAADSISEKKDIDDFEAEDSDEPEDNEIKTSSANGSAERPEPLREDVEPVLEAEDAEEPKGAADEKADDLPKKAAKKQGKKQGRPKKEAPDYEAIKGDKDKWGYFKGTKTAQAIEMYERGTTAKELNEVLGGRYYNMLSALQKAGHKVEKTDTGLWKVTHKDEK